MRDYDTTAEQQRRDEAMIEACCMIERSRHEHDIVFRKAEARRECALGEEQRVVRDEHRLRTTGGTGSGKDEHHFIGLAACFARIGFVFLDRSL